MAQSGGPTQDDEPYFVPDAPARVRAATASDTPELVRLLGALGYARDADALEQFVATQPSTHVIVATEPAAADAGADDHDRLAGLLALSLHPQLHLDAPTASLDALVVDARSRSRGIGRVLLDRAYTIARDAGAKRIELHSNLRRADAHRFYEREGFTMTSKFFVRELR